MSAREWQPGTVAVATVCGVPNVRVMRVDDGSRPWVTAECAHLFDQDVTDVRPLVVLDPEDMREVEALHEAYDREWARLFPNDYEAATDAPDGPMLLVYRAALRSLIRFPKPEEPTGLGAVVEDGEGDQYVRVSGDRLGWRLATRPVRFEARRYDDIAAVRVLSEGVQA